MIPLTEYKSEKNKKNVVYESVQEIQYLRVATFN